MLNKYTRIKFDRSADLPTVRELFQLTRLATRREKYAVITLISLGSCLFVAAVAMASQNFLVNIPAHGGEFSEGLIGLPRFINPLLATSDADRDLTSLVYSGLLRPLPNEGFLPDLAESYVISNDGLTYTFTLKKNLLWQDGHPLTAQDVVFTIHLAQDPNIKSLHRANWAGVTVEALDTRTVRFSLRQPYAPFLENMTMGILPEHIWKKVLPEEFALSVNNMKAIGSGPYKIETIKTDTNNIPTQIVLTTNSRFAIGEPLISKLTFKLYADEGKLLEAFKRKDVDSLSGLSTEAAGVLGNSGTQILTAPLSRVFGVFFNTNQSALLANSSVRRALSASAPRQDLITFALRGFGQVMGSTATSTTKIVKRAKVLQFTLATSDSPELKRAAALLSDTWKELGVNVSVKVYELSDLNTNIIRPRKFDALLFGEVVGHFPDPYAFWHSSQRLDPGLNIAQYTNPIADKALATARASADPEKRREQYAIFNQELAKDVPAIMLYAPEFIYVPARNVRGIHLETMSNSSDRFTQVYKWYIQTDSVWKIFSS